MIKCTINKLLPIPRIEESIAFLGYHYHLTYQCNLKMEVAVSCVGVRKWKRMPKSEKAIYEDRRLYAAYVQVGT